MQEEMQKELNFLVQEMRDIESMHRELDKRISDILMKLTNEIARINDMVKDPDD